LTNVSTQPVVVRPASLKLWLACGGGSAALGSACALIIAQMQAGDVADGLRWTLYMLASASLAAIIGLIFAVPRARSEFSPLASERYLANSNLEQISDWLTKLLVGAGLVELKNMPGYVAAAGAYLGAGMKVSNSSAYSATALMYGAGLGFGAAYLWTRLRLRLLLEASDRDAADASKERDALVEKLRDAGVAGTMEKEPVLRRAAEDALSVAKSTDPSAWGDILWVDDYPQNNSAIVEALSRLGIRVDLASSTDEALERIQTHGNYGLVISDLGRRENGQNNSMAGRDLLERTRAAGYTMPFFVFAGRRGLQHREELLSLGAQLVTNRASEVFSGAVHAVSDQS
jgi:CheY-like chemotaxis protein